MTIQEHISNFLRDSQYRIGEIGILLNEMSQQRGEKYDSLYEIRWDLIQFVDVLFNARWSFKDESYNFLEDWTEEEILKEIEHQRWMCGINEIPYLTFAAYYPWLRNSVNNNGTMIGTPAGTLGQYLVIGPNNVVVAEDFPDRAGMELGEDINDYFAGRL